MKDRAITVLITAFILVICLIVLMLPAKAQHLVQSIMCDTEPQMVKLFDDIERHSATPAKAIEDNKCMLPSKPVVFDNFKLIATDRTKSGQTAYVYQATAIGYLEGNTVYPFQETSTMYLITLTPVNEADRVTSL